MSSQCHVPDPCLFSIQGEPGLPGPDGKPGLAGLPGVRVSLLFLAFLEKSYNNVLNKYSILLYNKMCNVFGCCFCYFTVNRGQRETRAVQERRYYIVYYFEQLCDIMV